MSRAVTCRVALLALCLALAACGFRLAGTAELADSLELIRLETDNFSERQRKALRARLERAGALLAGEGDADATLLRVSFLNVPARDLVAGGSSGKTIERLTRSLRFSLVGADGEPLIEAKTLTRQRDFTRDEDNLLASNEERANLLVELEKSLFEQLIFQLGRI